MLKLRGGILDRPRTAMGYIAGSVRLGNSQGVGREKIQIRERGGDLRANAALMRGKERANVYLRLLRHQ